jgi:predicted acyltransferase
MEKSTQRLLSLDVFRGATVAAMILVNNPGDWGNIYAPLEHSTWNGCTPTDLIFPSFLFIVGVSIAYAMSAKKAEPALHRQTLVKAFKRAAILFGLGLFLALYPRVFIDPVDAFKTLRILGVLQRISIVFIVCTFVFIRSSEKTIFRIGVFILILYWFLMTFIPVPHLGYPNLEKETNLGAWLDRTLLTEAHLWKSGKTWDPEGLLSSLPAIATGLFGVLVGGYLRRKDLEPANKVAWLFTVGLITTGLGLLWDLQFPINKSLWTSSFVLYAGGIATLILAVCYWLIDVHKQDKYTVPFVVYGKNAITVFFLSGMLPRTLNLITLKAADGTQKPCLAIFYESYFKPYFSPVNASLVWAVTQVLFWFVILYIMYRKKIFIKV